MTLLSSSRSVLLIPSSEIVSTWCNLVPGRLLGGSVHVMALCLGLLQYRQRLLSILCLHSVGVSHPFFRNFPLFWVALISTLGASSPEISQTLALELRHGVRSEQSESGAAYMRQFLSRSLAFSTSMSRVVGWGDMLTNFWLRAWFKAWQKAYILVPSSTLAWRQ